MPQHDPHTFYSDWLNTRSGVPSEQVSRICLHPGKPPGYLVEMAPRILPPPMVGTDTPVHEAGHYVVGCVIGLEVSRPRVIAGDPDGFLGKVDVQAEPNDVDLAEVPPDLLRTLALQLAAFYLAGDIAECLAAGIRLTGNTVLQEDGPDLGNARRVLDLAGLTDDRGLVWAARYGERLCMFGWEHVLDVADNIRAQPPEHD